MRDERLEIRDEGYGKSRGTAAPGQVWLFAVRSPEQSFPHNLEVPDFSTQVPKELNNAKKSPR